MPPDRPPRGQKTARRIGGKGLLRYGQWDVAKRRRKVQKSGVVEQSTDSAQPVLGQIEHRAAISGHNAGNHTMRR